MTKRRIWATLMMCILFGSAVFARDATEVATRTFKSVVMLVVSDATGSPMAFGSGFFVKADIVATSLHVVDGASSVYIKAPGQDRAFPVAGILATDTDNDLALLQVNTDTTFPRLVLTSTAGTKVGSKVYVIGNPMGLEGTFTEGIVSAIRKENQSQILQITAPISHGSSGGPVLDEEGQVIGVAAALIENGQNLNFAIPSDSLLKLLSASRSLVAFHGKRQSGALVLRWQELQAGDSYEAAKQFIVKKQYPIITFDAQSITARVGQNPDVTVIFRFNNGKFFQYDMAISARDPLWILEHIQYLTAEFGAPRTATSVSGRTVHTLMVGDGFLMTWWNDVEHVVYVVSSLPPASNIVDPFDVRTPRVREIRTALRVGPPPIPTRPTRQISNKPSETTR